MTPTKDQPILTRIAFIMLWLFVFTIPMTQAVEIPMIGTISRALGLAAVAAVFIAAAGRRKIRLLAPLHIALATFILWSAVTLCWSVAPDLTLQRIVTYLQLFVLVFMVWEVCVQEKQVLGILSAFVCGTILPALSTLKGFVPGQQIIQERARLLQPGIGGYDPDQLAFLLALSLPAAYYLILHEKGPIASLYRLQMGFAICAILLTGSGSSMIAMVVGLSLVCWTFDVIPVRTRANAFAVVMLLIGGAIMLVPSAVWQGIAEQTRKGDITMTSVVDQGIASIRTTPVGGFGAGTRSPSASANAASRIHPMPLTMFAETGVVGVLCFITVLGVLLMATDGMSGVNKSFWLTSLGVWTVGALSLNWDCSQPAWLIFGLLAAHSSSISRKPSAEAEGPAQRDYYFDAHAEVWS